MKRYNPKDIEPKWQAKWQQDKIYQAVDFDKRPKYVMLTEFPYPSGSGMHIGHIREYTLGDIIARQKRMQGHNVLFPMGYDAFGLPTENYAIKNKLSPQQATEENVANFQQQLESMGFSFDWSRSFKTSDPAYYKWTQWLFLRFLEANMAYQEEIAVNWCPFCRTGLANEEVINGRHERCDTPVEKKLLKQWLLRITDYADRLIEGLDSVDFPPRIADQQVNWIGRSKGAEIEFDVANSDSKITVFTTRPDTIFGATFLVLAPEHPLVEAITSEDHREQVNTYIRAAGAKSDVERQENDKAKSGVFTGAHAVNPATKKQIPIWIADYILMGYGTGAIMAVPGHDQRDMDFAKKYELPVDYVIEPVGGQPLEGEAFKEAIVAIVRNPKTDQVLMLDWGPRHSNYGGQLFIGGGLDGNEDEVEGALREIAEESGYSNLKLVAKTPYFIHSHYYSNTKKQNSYAKIRGMLFDLIDETMQPTKLDVNEKGLFTTHWVGTGKAETMVDDESHRYVYMCLIKGQAYSGEGVMTNSGKYNGMNSAEARDKIIADLIKQGQAKERTNYRLRDWIFSRQHYWGEPIPVIHCPEHGVVAVPDDQLPVKLPDVDHYEPTETGESPLAVISDWVNTTCPICGQPAKRETDTMPNWAGSSWYYLRYFDPKNDQVFAGQKKLDYWGMVDLYLGGMEHTTLHLLYSRFWHQFLFDQGLVPTKEPYAARRGQGIVLAADGSKMSKSKGNVVNPTEIIDSGYGADALRLAIAFLAPYDQTTPWSPETLGGTIRFLQRVWTLVQQFDQTEGGLDESVELKKTINKTIKKVSRDLIDLGFNTAIASLMECVNELYKIKADDNYQAVEWQWALESLVKLLAPFAPHIAEELWEQLGNDETVHLSDWPQYDDSYTKDEEIMIAVQVNGKIRAELKVKPDSKQEVVEQLAYGDTKVAKSIEGKNVKRVIYVPGKLLSLVVD